MRGERENEIANERLRETRGGPPSPSALAASCRRAMTWTAAERLGKKQSGTPLRSNGPSAPRTCGPLARDSRPAAGRTHGPAARPHSRPIKLSAAARWARSAAGAGPRACALLQSPRCMPSGVNDVSVHAARAPSFHVRGRRERREREPPRTQASLPSARDPSAPTGRRHRTAFPSFLSFSPSSSPLLRVSLLQAHTSQRYFSSVFVNEHETFHFAKAG
jgi:hypothetical protein